MSATYDLTLFIEKLNPICRSALDRAAALCVARENIEVDIEHLLRCLLDAASSDFVLLLREFNVDTAIAASQLDHVIAQRRRGTETTPLMSSSLLTVLRDGCLASSLLLKSSRTRSGGLLFAIFDEDSLRDAVIASCPALARITREELRGKLRPLSGGSAESDAQRDEYEWRGKKSVMDALFHEGHRFSFLQAVRLLEELYLNETRTAPGEGVNPDREIVRFRSEVRLDFPPTDVDDITYTGGDPPAEMSVNVLGLAGVHGPLPYAVTELILEREFRKDTALRDFLDVFNHRLVSLLYRARKKFRPALDPMAPDSGRVARVLQAFLGIGMPALHDRMAIPDRALFSYAGMFVDTNRSQVGLRRLLEDYFETGVTIVPFCGEWDRIEESDTTVIGNAGRNQILGFSAVLGGRVWNQVASIEVRIGPLTFHQFLMFLPNGSAYAALVAAVRFYLRDEISFSVRLTIAAGEVPGLYIGKKERAYLGWTTWLGVRAMNEDDSQVRFAERA